MRVELNDANDCVVSGNRLEACGIGLNLWRWCRQDELNVRNEIRDNQFLSTRGNGLQIQADTARNSIRGNIVRGCGGSGISLNGTEQLLSSNTVSGAQREGIIVSGNRNEVTGISACHLPEHAGEYGP